MQRSEAQQLAEAAVAFAKSPFGKHYLKRLNDLKTKHLANAMNVDFTDSYRAHHATKAAVLEQEIEYFRIAQVAADRSLMEKLKALGKKEDASV